MRIKHVLTALLAITVLFSCVSGSSSTGKKTEAQLFVEDMGIGYNLGNTLDACGGGTRGRKIVNFETAWGAPVTTKEIFEDLKSRGINTVRIPVAWSNLVEEDWTISAQLMDRAEEVVNMALDSGMYVILNIHWDGGWIDKIPLNYEEGMYRYNRYWDQICERFKDYDDHLIFESMNEEGCFNDMWDRWTGNGDKASAYGLLNHINQTFVDLVRASGGNNANRFLLIAGYATDIDLTIDPLFLMPKDKQNHSIVSVHYYTPSNFSIISEDASWGKSVPTWGSDSEYARVKTDLNKMKTHFVDKGIPVIIGEHGTVVENKDPESVRKYITAVATTAYEMGMCPVLWGASGDVYDRRALEFTDPLIGEMYLELSQIPRD